MTIKQTPKSTETKIIKIARAPSANPLLSFIDDSYAALEAIGGFTTRAGQKEFSVAIAESFVAGVAFTGEAPTGTGKTIAYLIGAIAASERLSLTAGRDVAVLVATATVGLQSQVLEGDLPRLYAAGIIRPGSVSIAKGRGRYFCPQAADNILKTEAVELQGDFFDTAANESNEEVAETRSLMNLWRASKWVGDIDSLPSTTPAVWPKLAAASNTCTTQKCPHYKACPFFSARMALSTARIIIANHSLVLADLKSINDGADSLIPGNKVLVVFDEAHHLPDKAIDTGTARLDVNSFFEQLEQAAKITIDARVSPTTVGVLRGIQATALKLDPAALKRQMMQVKIGLQALNLGAAPVIRRFPGGKLPGTLGADLGRALLLCESLAEVYAGLLKKLKTTTFAEKNPKQAPALAEFTIRVTALSTNLTAACETLYLLTNGSSVVRWVESADGRISLNTAPLHGADVLRKLLWKQSDRFTVAMVSATLQGFGSFDRYKEKVGAPENTNTMALPHVFPYAENELHIINTASSPAFATAAAFESELIKNLPKVIDPTAATLILLPSKAMFAKVTAALAANFGDKVLTQGELGMKPLLEKHKQRVDQGLGSILCGLATMAEGLDLPGAYCTHVVICKLPFKPPTSPIEQELQDVMGDEYFSNSVMPDVLTALTQMVGRLMRRETDRGVITVFDKRLNTTGWGRKLLAALPPFKLVSKRI